MSLATIIGLVVTVSIFLTVLSFGLRATLGEAFYLFGHPALLFRALLAVCVIMPLVSVLLVWLFNLQPIVEVVLVALSLSPVPPILPDKAFKAGGRRSYTIGLLTALSILSIVLIPLSLEIFERLFERP